VVHAYPCCRYMYLQSALSITSKFLADAQTDVQDVPVDGDQLIRRLAVLLIYQCMSVPISGTTISPGYHSSTYITDMSEFYVLTGQVTYRMTFSTLSSSSI
jgi:hypothetical protein